MTLSTQPYKGTRDFYPEDYRLQKYIFETWRKSVESFGYEQYDAPLLEPLDLYLAKSGQEIVTEQTYEFTDRGGRRVAIRPEMTPTIARMVAARRQELPYPYRVYSIPNLWRYERPQRGRLREHWQLNVDLFGVDNIQAELEIISVADDIMQRFGAKRSMYKILISSRKLVNYFLREVIGFDETQTQSAIKLIDRMHKMDAATFAGLLDGIMQSAQREAGKHDELMKFLRAKSPAEMPESIKSSEHYTQVIQLLDQLGIANAEFDPTLMRGFDYYTDVVFEVMDTDSQNNRSLFGGGRYDGLVGLFGAEPVPTIGFGMGDVALGVFLQSHDLVPNLDAHTEVYVVVVGDVAKEAQKVVSSMRKEGLRIAVDISGKKIDKQLKAADKHNVKWVMFIGEQELEDEQFGIKNLRTGNNEKHSVERLVSIIKDKRNN